MNFRQRVSDAFPLLPPPHPGMESILCFLSRLLPNEYTRQEVYSSIPGVSHLRGVIHMRA